MVYAASTFAGILLYLVIYMFLSLGEMSQVLFSGCFAKNAVRFKNWHFFN